MSTLAEIFPDAAHDAVARAFRKGVTIEGFLTEAAYIDKLADAEPGAYTRLPAQPVEDRGSTVDLSRVYRLVETDSQVPGGLATEYYTRHAIVEIPAPNGGTIRAAVLW